MKVLCLLDGVFKPGYRWLWKYLPANNDELGFLVTTWAAETINEYTEEMLSDPSSKTRENKR